MRGELREYGSAEPNCGPRSLAAAARAAVGHPPRVAGCGWARWCGPEPLLGPAAGRTGVRRLSGPPAGRSLRTGAVDRFGAIPVGAFGWWARSGTRLGGGGGGGALAVCAHRPRQSQDHVCEDVEEVEVLVDRAESASGSILEIGERAFNIFAGAEDFEVGVGFGDGTHRPPLGRISWPPTSRRLWCVPGYHAVEQLDLRHVDRERSSFQAAISVTTPSRAQVS